MTVRLYSYWRSSAAYRVRIALNLKGIGYETVALSLLRDGGEHRRDAYKAVNPQMLVPFLDDGTAAIGQSQAILEYLEEHYPGPRLLPDDAATRARVRMFCNVICCDIHPLNNLRVMQYLEGPLAAGKDQRKEWYAHWIHSGFAPLEAMLADWGWKGPYAFGSAAGFADICLVPQIYNARRYRVDLDAYPRLLAIDEACAALPAFANAAPDAQADAGS